MWNGKKKAITFSFDDNVMQDDRLIELFNRYGCKATFNLNYDLMGEEATLSRNGVTVRHDKHTPEQVLKVYGGHEVAAHTLTHPFLPNLTDEEIVREVEQDRQKWSRLLGYEVVGLAYPGGGENWTPHIRELVRHQTKVQYGRGNGSSRSFELPEELLAFNNTIYYVEDDLFDLAETFLKMDPETPKQFSIWGHSYEMDANYISWERFEEFLKLISFKEDIFYGTNKEVFLSK